MADETGMMTPEEHPAGRTPAMGSAESPEEVRREISRTRTQMSRTFHELKERVNREHLMEQADKLRDQAVGAAREATVGRADEYVTTAGERVRGIASRAINVIRAHPIPALLAVAVVGFLVYQLRSR